MRDDELIRVDEFAKNLCREMGYSGAEYVLEVVGTQNAVLSRAKHGDFTLYRESRPYPFALDGLEEVHGALRISLNDAAVLSCGFMGKPDHEQALQTQAVTAEAVGALFMPIKAWPAALSTGDIAFCFAGLRWKTESKWKKPLGDKPKWLSACVVTAGVQGVSERLWNPVSIGAALVSNGHCRVNSVRAKFQTEPLLSAWRDEWKTYEAEHFDTE
jgi:hypothetical protein